MRKSMLLAAAALTLGVLSASAQSNVYSVNIVGYVNTVLKGGGAFTLVANPLDDGKGNQLTNLLASLPNKSSVQVWNGTGFTPYDKVAGAWGGNVALPPGTGFFVQTPAASGNLTNTFVGNVLPSPATNTLPGGVFSLVGSKLPIGGNLTDTNFNLGTSLANKSSIQVWDNTGSGAFIPSDKVAGSWGSNLTISVGQGFFVVPNGTSNWVQTLPAP